MKANAGLLPKPLCLGVKLKLSFTLILLNRSACRPGLSFGWLLTGPRINSLTAERLCNSSPHLFTLQLPAWMFVCLQDPPATKQKTTTKVVPLCFHWALMLFIGLFISHQRERKNERDREMARITDDSYSSKLLMCWKNIIQQHAGLF